MLARIVAGSARNPVFVAIGIAGLLNSQALAQFSQSDGSYQIGATFRCLLARSSS